MPVLIEGDKVIIKDGQLKGSKGIVIQYHPTFPMGVVVDVKDQPNKLVIPYQMLDFANKEDKIERCNELLKGGN